MAFAASSGFVAHEPGLVPGRLGFSRTNGGLPLVGGVQPSGCSCRRPPSVGSELGSGPAQVAQLAAAGGHDPTEDVFYPLAGVLAVTVVWIPARATVERPGLTLFILGDLRRRSQAGRSQTKSRVSELGSTLNVAGLQPLRPEITWAGSRSVWLSEWLTSHRRLGCRGSRSTHARGSRASPPAEVPCYSGQPQARSLTCASPGGRSSSSRQPLSGESQVS